MPQCEHRWAMSNIEYGFMVFERCPHCNTLRTHFSTEGTWDEYRDGDCTFSVVENAQTFRFDLACTRCNHVEKFNDLMGLLHCTGCLPDCKVELLRQECLAQRTFVLVAFGLLPESRTKQIPQRKLDILTDHFNQRRDTLRSTIKIVPFGLIDNLSSCRGEFIYDVGMLSLEPPEKRKPLL
ncbi:MAG TPA: hypothetical protein VMY05_07040 [Acidobacteriota bacterium]|nr:hypothetical protein [Acidobacteriota bacterium]